MLFKISKKLNLVMFFVVCFCLVTNVVFAGSDLDRALSSNIEPVNSNFQNYTQYSNSDFIRSQIYSLVEHADLSGNKGNRLSEELKNTARNNFKLHKDEEILYAYSTQRGWFGNDSDNKISEGCVITDYTITIVVDYKKPNEYLKILWEDFYSCEYQDNCLYFNTINNQPIQLHLGYITTAGSNMSYSGNRIAKAFTSIPKYLKEKENQENKDIADYENKLIDKIFELQEKKQWNKLNKFINEELDKNSWLYHLAKAELLTERDGLFKEALKENDKAFEIINQNENILQYQLYYLLADRSDIYFRLKEYNKGRKCLLNIVNYNMMTPKEVMEIMKEIDSTGNFYNEYNENFYKIPYNERKIIMPVEEDALRNTDSFVMLDIDNLPENMIFPHGHPIEGELYVGHPFLPNKYFPIEDHELELTEDKIREFCDFVEGLGAIEVYVENISFIDEGGIRHTEKVRGGSIGVTGYGAIGGNYGTANSREFENELKKIVKIHETFSPNQAPKLVENLHWYNQEPSWKRLYEKRMRGALIEHSETISTEQSSMVKEDVDKDINGEINILGVSLGGKYSKLENKEYHQNKDIEIVLHVIFAPLKELKPFEEKK